MAEKMNLEELRRSAGLEVYQLAEEANVPIGFIKEAEHSNLPMARNKMLRVLEVLSKHHGRPIGIADVKEMHVV